MGGHKDLRTVCVLMGKWCARSSLHNETVNAERYCETLQKLRRIIQNRQRGMLSAGVVLLKDNARPHTFDGKHIFYRNSAGKCLTIQLIARTSRPVIFIFSYTSRNSCRSAPSIAFSEWERSGDECNTVVTIPGGKSLRHRVTNVGPTVKQMSKFRRWKCWKLAEHLLFLFQ